MTKDHGAPDHGVPGPWSPRSPDPTLKDMDQRSLKDIELPKSEQRKESVAGQCKMRREVSLVE